jgi:hypothetical protein
MEAWPRFAIFPCWFTNGNWKLLAMFPIIHVVTVATHKKIPHKAGKGPEDYRARIPGNLRIDQRAGAIQT